MEIEIKLTANDDAVLKVFEKIQSMPAEAAEAAADCILIELKTQITAKVMDQLGPAIAKAVMKKQFGG